MDRCRVLFIVHGLWRAGAETQLVNLVNELPADTFEKHITWYREGDDLKEDLDSSQVRVLPLARRRRFDLGVARAIGHYIDEHRIDVVHCTMRNATFYGYLGRRFSKRKPALVAALHSTRNDRVTMNIADALFNRRILRRCDRVWFVSSLQRERWIRRMPFLASNAVTIHNGVDTDEFDPASFAGDAEPLRDSLGIDATETVFCCVARFQPVKLHNVLLDAFAKVIAGGHRCRLLLAGSGALECDLRAQVRRLGLSDRVEFLGQVSDVRPVLSASDCMLLVSRAETFSMAMLEAMAMRLPVILTSAGGAAEAVEEGVSGFLVEPGNREKLAGRMIEIAGDGSHRAKMGEAARNTVIERFSMRRMIATSSDSLLAAAAEKRSTDDICKDAR